MLYGAGAIVSALLNSQRSYFWPAVGPIFNNVVADSQSLGIVSVQRPLPVVGSGGTICPHCGYNSGHERAFYCPKCGMRMLRG